MLRRHRTAAGAVTAVTFPRLRPEPQKVYSKTKLSFLEKNTISSAYEQHGTIYNAE